jgi:hypothetical protein
MHEIEAEGGAAKTRRFYYGGNRDFILPAPEAQANGPHRTNAGRLPNPIIANE